MNRLKTQKETTGYSFALSAKKDSSPSINRRIRREVDKFTSEIQDDLRQLSKALSLSVRPTRWA